MQVHEGFSEDFKALWEPGSQMRTVWDQLEILYQGVQELAQSQGVVQSQHRPLNEIRDDMSSKKVRMELLHLETVQVLWTKIIYRTQLKVLDSLRLVFYSSNTRNAYGCALGVRAIVEHIAFMQYFASQVPWKDQPFDISEAGPFTAALFNLSLGSHLDWDKLSSGQMRKILEEGKWDRPRDDRLPLIARLIDNLDSCLYSAGKSTYRQEIRFLYGALCDIVHPSWGGDFIYAPNMYSTMSPSAELSDRFKVTVTLFCGALVGLIAYFVSLHEALTSAMPNAIFFPDQSSSGTSESL